MVRRRLVLLPASAVALALVPGTAVAAPGDAAVPTSGASGIGDPYYPLDGNGGYEVEHYGLALRYDPATDELTATATIEAVATQSLSAFNLDLQGLVVDSVTVDDADATWSRDTHELTITPAGSLADGAAFTTVVTYHGVPETLPDHSGFMHTDDGAVVAGQPEGAATWFPANDHPSDPASVAVTATVPEGLEAVSNGELLGSETADGWTTWRWSAPDPMATYLVTLAIGDFDLRAYEAGGIRYWDALDPDLFTAVAGGTSTAGDIAAASFARQPEIIGWLFATYAEWMWREHEGLQTTQQSFDALAALPADSPLWANLPGDPGPAQEDLFSLAVYNRGAMTLHALRTAVGDDVFAQIVRDWVSSQAGQAVTTADFIALAEQVSGQQLDDLFQTWLFTPGKPAVLG
jgi:aminopeptidase N